MHSLFPSSYVPSHKSWVLLVQIKGNIVIEGGYILRNSNFATEYKMLSSESSNK